VPIRRDGVAAFNSGISTDVIRAVAAHVRVVYASAQLDAGRHVEEVTPGGNPQETPPHVELLAVDMLLARSMRYGEVQQRSRYPRPRLTAA
jgi:hypothetical protein